MPARSWWTVFGVYDEDESPLYEFIEAKDKAEAKSRILRKVDSVVLIAGIAPGKVTGAEIDELDNVVPIRGKHHEIEVTHVRVTRRKFLIPGRCPGCKRDLRRAGAMREIFLREREWRGHLSHDSKHYVHERDIVSRTENGATHGAARLACAECNHVIWEGLHVDE
jgi:hypothetical protein